MEDLREQFPILSKYTYLNTARFGALPKSVTNIQKQFLEQLNTDGSWSFERWSGIYENTRRESSQLIGCSSDNTFFLPNVSLGFNMAAQYLPKRKVICLKGDFPSVSLTWEPHGFEVLYLDYKSDDFYDQLKSELSESGKILSISWIQSEDGFEIDLNFVFNICKENNHILILDGTQGLGAIPFKVDPNVDCLFLASGFKWLMAGYGIAVAYASEKILKYLKPMRGWNSGFLPGGNIVDGAKSLEVGNATFLNVAALSEGLKVINELTVESISASNLILKNLVQTRLLQANRLYKKHESRSSIVSFEANEEEYKLLTEKRIQSSWQSGFIRISPHFYNNESDIENLLSVIA